MKPYYKKKLSETDIKVRLSFPMEIMKEALVLPQKEGAKLRLEATDNSNTQKKWMFRLSTRKGQHPKPVLSAGWLAYVREKRLRKGDRLIIYVEKDKATRTRFRIQAQRKVPFKLFGTEFKEKKMIWTDVEKLKSDAA